MAQAHGRRTAIPNVEQLRRDFIAAADGKLTLVDDKVERSPEVWGSFRHWLAFVKASSPGIYTVKYSITFADGSYVRGERTYEFRVLERGCQRSVQPYIGAGNFCLGDTVILPVRLDGYLGHKFTVTKRSDTEPTSDGPRNYWQIDPAQPQPPPESVSNPLADNLEFIGTVRHDAVNRRGDVSVSYIALFKAIRPGRFNLAVGPVIPVDSTDEDSPTMPERAYIVVDRTTPVTFLADGEQTLDFSHYPGVTVGNSNNYQTDNSILQVGDMIALDYAGRFFPVNTRPPKRPDETMRTLRPVIIKRPFNPETGRYNAWVRDYLP